MSLLRGNLWPLSLVCWRARIILVILVIGGVIDGLRVLVAFLE